ncbi:TonB-dependent receptor [Catenovulum sp. 2E275]|uniref:TonB-dependent receptor n=1 Tax=Catenovulum sp. 2E275 TaxID=2980497 RepID=UPI0021CECBD5|nr:TonB-dependent receptor [Catenovulum sp. 2E275]MCU4674655.1 TonB-dependent receptor [Catenovulum sp. 2E275]
MNINQALSCPANCLLLAGSLLISSNFVFADNQIDDVIEIKGEKTTFKTNYTLLQRQDFLNQGVNLSDILQKQAGIQIRQVGGLGNQVSVSIRGSTDKQVQFYIDGQLINSGQFGSFDLNQLPLDQIQSIEISKNQAVGTGSTPIGGVIKINTFDPNKPQTRLSGAVGSFDLAEFSALKSIQLGNHQMSINLSYLTTANNYPYKVPAPLYNPQTAATENLRNNDYQKLNAYFNDSFVLDDHKIKASFQFIEQNKNLPSYRNNSDKNQASLDTYTRRVNVSDDWLIGFDLLEQVSLEAYLESKGEVYQDKFISTRQERHDYQTDTQAINLSALFNLDEVTAVPYFKVFYSEYESQSFLGKQGLGCSGLGSCDIISEQTQYHLGSRFEYQNSDWSAHLLLNQLWDENSNRINQQTDYAFEPKLNSENYFTFDSSLNYQIHPAQQLSFSLARGVRIPALFERYGDRGMLKGNDDLQPEKSSTLSFNYLFKAQNWQLNSSIYQTDQENAIVAIFNSSGVGSYQNISASKILGFELMAQYALSNKLDLDFNMTLLDSNTESNISSFNKKMLPGIYHQQYQTRLNYQLNQNIKLSLDVSHDKDLYFSRANIDKQRAKRTVVDLNAHYQLRQWKISLQALNLFDQNYQDLANRPAMGRAFKLSFTLEEINL